MLNKTILLACLLAGQMAQAQWSNFANGNTNGTVVDFAVFNNEIYATGLFTQINGTNANGVAKWDGSAWQPFGTGFVDGGHRLSVIDSSLYLARYEMQVDSNWIYRLTNGAWEKLGTGFYLTGANAGQFYTCSLYDVLEYNGEIYACGEFNRNGSQDMNGIAKRDGTAWSPLGGGLSEPFFGQSIYPHQLLVANGLLYVCGNFTKADGVTVNGVAAWNGSQWTALGAGFNSTVYALGVYNNELYAGGDFSMSGGTAVGAVAKWDGSQWVSPGFDFQYNNPNGYLFVHTIKAINDKLYFSGGFDQVTPAAGSPLNAGSIVALEGQNIDVLQGGANNDVEGLAYYDGKLLVGGYFSSVGSGVNASKLALYDLMPAAIKPVEKQPLFTIYPNPSNGMFTIENLPTGAVFNYELLDLNGQLIEQGIAGGQLHVPALNPGVYLLKILGENEYQTIKVVIK